MNFPVAEFARIVAEFARIQEQQVRARGIRCLLASFSSTANSPRLNRLLRLLPGLMIALFICAHPTNRGQEIVRWTLQRPLVSAIAGQEVLSVLNDRPKIGPPESLCNLQ